MPKLKNEIELYGGTKSKRRRGPRQAFGLDVAPIAEDVGGEKSSDRKTIGEQQSMMTK